MNCLLKGRGLELVTALSVTFHGTGTLFYFGESASSVLLAVLSLFSPLAIMVTMVCAPRPFFEQLRSWGMGMCYSLLISTAYIYMLVVYDRGLSLWDVLISFYVAILLTFVVSLLFSACSFLLGALVNCFQHKSELPLDVGKVFQ